MDVFSPNIISKFNDLPSSIFISILIAMKCRSSCQIKENKVASLLRTLDYIEKLLCGQNLQSSWNVIIMEILINSHAEWTGFPLRLENLEKWEGIFQSGKSQGILNRLEKSGKITQNTGKLREFEINIIWYF